MADPRSPVAGPSRTRAMSPAQAGYVHGSIESFVRASGDFPHAASTARTLSLGMATSLTELLALVPVDFRETLRPYFKALQDVGERKASVAASLAKLERHKANGTFPTAIQGLHVPVFQFNKPWLESGLEEKPEASFQKLVDQCRADALDLAIKMKTEERDFFEAAVRPQEWLQDWHCAVAEVVKRMSKLHQRPLIVPDNNGGERIDKWETDPTFARLVKDLYEDLVQFGVRILVLQEAKGFAAEAREAAKKKLKDTADVEMGDATEESRMEDLVQRALEKRMLKFKPFISLSDHFLLSDLDLSLSIVRSPQVYGQKRPSGQTEKEGEEERGWKRRKTGQSQGHRQEARETRGILYQGQEVRGPQTWSIQRARQEGQRQSESIVAAACWRYENPLSYPDEILDLPLDLAVRYLLSSAPPAMVAAMRFRSDVHVGPGVELPRLISTSLSVGLRCMFSRRPLGALISNAYHDFCERLRWRIHFMNEESRSGATQQQTDYDPDYDLHLPRKKQAPIPEHYIQDGLDAGWTYVHDYIANVVPTIVTQRDYASSLIDWQAVQESLRANKLIVTVTDKNLGVAIITKQWFIEGVETILNDPTQYESISTERCHDILKETVREVRSIAEGLDSEGANEQLVKFLVHKCPAEESDGLPSVPRFYVIPKIHKKPVKHRPIIPCHSSAQAPAAKYVSKMLKPLVERCKFVLHGTKHLARKFSTLKLEPGKKAWLVSGDVVAFYPSIPLDEALDIVMILFKAHYANDLNERQIELFRRCLLIANLNNVVEFQGRFWLQTQGLAMGQAPSPDIANLWGAYFEEHLFSSERSLKDLGWAFIGRYIDDVLGIVYADSAENALKVASILRYDDPGEQRVRLLWEVSEYNVPFLDMLVYIDPVTGQIGHRPYQKKLNHKERIPWVSHHPKDVKRGTYIGEMSRLATLSSSVEEYVSAIRDLKGLYMARGYPEKLVLTWTKDHLAERWAQRLSEPAPARPVLVLKTEFNPAWYAFNVDELGSTITTKWMTYLNAIYDHMWRTESAAEKSRREFKPGVPLGTSIGFTPEARTFVIDEYPVSVAKQKSSAPLRDEAPSAGGPSGSNGTEHGRLPSGSAVELGQGLADARWRRVVPSERPCDWIVTHYGRLTDGGSGEKSVEETIFDVKRAGLCDKRWLVSRKRTRNLFDVSQAWKRSLLTELDSSRDDSPDYWDQLVDIDISEVEV